MRWSLASLKALHGPSRRATKRSRCFIVEDLEGRRLLSHAVQPVVTLPSLFLLPSNVISAPDGNLWVGVSPSATTAAIDRITLDGSVTSFPVPGNAPGGFTIDSLTTGPDGNIWFVANTDVTATDSQVEIGKVTPSGQVTTFPTIAVPAGDSAYSGHIVSGPDDDLWFSYSVGPSPNQTQSFIGQVTTAGAVTLFPTTSSTTQSSLYSIAAGPDGNLWFTESVGKNFVLGRMSAGGAVTQFPLGHLAWAEVANGPNGGLVVSAGKNVRSPNEVLRVSPSGSTKPYKIAASINKSFGFLLGSAQGSLWFSTASGPFQLGEITAGGAAKSYKVSSAIHLQQLVPSMALGQDGNLYVLGNVDFVSAADSHTTSTLYRVSPSELKPVR